MWCHSENKIMSHRVKFGEYGVVFCVFGIKFDYKFSNECGPVQLFFLTTLNFVRMSGKTTRGKAKISTKIKQIYFMIIKRPKIVNKTLIISVIIFTCVVKVRI